MRGQGRSLAALIALTLVSACTLIPAAPPPKGYPAPSPTSVPTVAPPSLTALQVGVRPGPAIETLALASARPAAALRSFAESCRSLLVRTDQSGLTRTADWRAACSAAPGWPAATAAAFFNTHFETARVADGSSYVTGYYEPEIAGVRSAQPGFAVPIYRMPPDLVRAWPFETPFEQRVGQPPLGKFDADGRFVAYYDRAAIEDGALAGKGLELAYAADPIEFFFLQVQGSGRLIAPDGSVMRIGYAGQNGWPYTGIGGVMKDRGLVGDGPGQYPGSMQGIMRYLREHPEDGKALMRLDRAYIFFREVTGDGPVGALNVPVRGQVSLAADPAYVPLGAPVWLSTDSLTTSGLWVAQDTGGAIKGANRFDSFWGAGPTARQIAGGMAARGSAMLLLPKGTLARLGIR
jgi:membrane-bound lytic murein transglycosylase A